MIRQRIVFRGQVQGVGFRYRTQRAARMHGTTGWVRNEGDGSVTLEVQGSAEQIGMVLQEIRRSRYLRVSGMEVTDVPVREGETGFGIRF